MDIYEAPGTDAIVDLRKASAELKGSSSIVNERDRARAVAEISAAAALDIAASLRVIAAEALAAMPSAFAYIEELDGGGEPEPADDFFTEGDLVRVIDTTAVLTILTFGSDQGEHYANVADEAGEPVGRYYLRNLERLVGDEREIDPDEWDGTDPIGVGDPTDIDADFDGDSHDVAASALDALREREKKSKKKGGKK